MTHCLRSISLLALVVSLAACGGPLAHTADAYDASKVSAEQRQSVDTAEAVAADARRRAKDAEDQVAVDEEALENTEAAVERSEYAVELAKAELGVEEVKSDGDQAANVSGAKNELEHKRRDLAVGQAQVELAEEQLERSQLAAKEAHHAWLVALARLELAKCEAVGGDGPEAKTKLSELATQLTEVEAEHSEAKAKLAVADEAVRQAQQTVNEVKASF